MGVINGTKFCTCMELCSNIYSSTNEAEVNMDMRNSRHKLGVTRQVLAKDLGISVRMIDYIESGQRPMQKHTELAIECLLRRAGKHD